MLKKYLILSVLALFGLIIPQTAQAQIKNVSGRILEKHIGNKGRNLPFEEEVHVLAYNTVEAARRELEKLKQPGASAIMAMDYDEEAFPDAQGYYNIRGSRFWCYRGVRLSGYQCTGACSGPSAD